MLSWQKWVSVSEQYGIYAACCGVRLVLKNEFLQVVQMCAEKVVVPDEIDCCCWFGVHGFIHPEENASTLKSLKYQLPVQ